MPKAKKYSMDKNNNGGQINIAELTKVIGLLINKLNPFLIYMFGSAATGEMRSDSDIDLAIYCDVPVDQYSLFVIAQEISDIVNRDIDLIDMRKVSTVFKAQIIGNGAVIYCSDDPRRMNMEMRIFKDYSMLNEERAEILKNIQESRRIYGR